MLDNLLLFMVLFAAIPGIAFPLLYGFRSNWRRDYVGWMQMNMSATIGIVMLFVLFLIFDPHPELVQYVRVFEFFIIGCALWWQLWVWHKARREQRNSPNRRKSDMSDKEHHHG